VISHRHLRKKAITILNKSPIIKNRREPYKEYFVRLHESAIKILQDKDNTKKE
jgi:hypothetical protein